jgi:CubicO group peptidase (beta-lactamase class C family)
MNSGGLFSTPEDLARFLAFQFSDDREDEAAILSGDGIRRMRVPRSVPKLHSVESYGLGWSMSRLHGYQVIAHSGGHHGFFARMEALPQLKLGVVTMTNASYPEGYIGPEKNVSRIILEEFIPVFEDIQNEQPAIREEIDLHQYEGHYVVAGNYAEAVLQVRDEMLHMQLVQQPDFNEPFLPLGSLRFCFASDPERNPMLSFTTDKSGTVNGVKFLSYSFKKQ